MFLKIEIFEKLFVVNYVKIKWLGYVQHWPSWTSLILILLLIILHQEMSREVFFEGLKYLIENTILDIIDLDTIINDFASRNVWRFFSKDWGIWGNYTSFFCHSFSLYYP